MPKAKQRSQPQGTGSQITSGSKSKQDKNPSTNANAEIDKIRKSEYKAYATRATLQLSVLGFSAVFLPTSAVLQEWIQYLEGKSEPVLHEPLEALAARPVWTMATLGFATCLIQSWWSKALKAGWLKGQEDGSSGSKDNGSLPRVYGSLIVASLGIHGLLVLFGAPLFSHVLETYLLAFLIANLAVLPPVTVFGPPALGNDGHSQYQRHIWRRLYAGLSWKNPIERAILYPTIGTLIGSWLGVIPLALDWERPWQAWPLTPAYGAIIGYILASIVAATATGIDLTVPSD
ncbi:hypothetical protein CC1G_07539 [Coprinopsis cinerea okayama7|uniref:Glycosylphosphatidylinositol anchor biosynthesis protein 11 n=1 Tax=Coprinopsis cinerea (strain Okayama-7 / 130 / ATCC MYA-4618 / FGSC 9003) TaxID=240176 RepID=A8P189_COPC7|nr:hypothetical protein CC1G_07539 [Coprinopsis cinerea okayama7\|eukprot:XP_001838049.1 hypothetical protein CC1G_07539 [Coprinopsis cinerea okayama7\